MDLVEKTLGSEPTNAFIQHEELIFRLGPESEVYWSSGKLAKLLLKGEEVPTSCEVLWSLLQYYDMHDRANGIIREFVRSETGIILEPSPPIKEESGFTIEAYHKTCDMKNNRNSDNVKVQIDGESLLVEIPFSDLLRKALFRGIQGVV